jgi:hypothetical protein
MRISVLSNWQPVRFQRSSKRSAYEEEKRRAEALAEIDRAKTAFFSNSAMSFGPH